MAGRPLLLPALCFMGGIWAADLVSFWLPGLFALSYALGFAALAWTDKRRVLLGPLLFCAGAVAQSLELQPLSPLDIRHVAPAAPEYVTVLGRLRETPRARITFIRGRQGWRSRAVIDVEAIVRGDDKIAASGKVVAQASDELPAGFFAGRAVAVTGVLKTPPGPLADGMFDYRAYLRRQGVSFELDARETNSWQIRADSPQPSRPPLSDRFLAWARHALANGLPEEDTPLRLNWAMMLDWKEPLSADLTEPFLRAGTLHIFAVDGLRIGLITAIFLALFRLARLPRGWASLAVIPVLWFYAGATGWAASAIRATLMMSVILVGWSARRPSDLLNSLAGAAFVILVWQPHQLFQAGFQLSFVVVACIAIVGPPLRKIKLRQPDPLAPPVPDPTPSWATWTVRYAKETCLASLAAWLGSIPLTAYYFNLFSVASVPGNLLVMPLCLLCLVCDLASLLTATLFPWVSGLFNNAAWLLMSGIMEASRLASNFPAGARYVASPSLVAVLFFYLALLTISTGWIFRSAHKAKGRLALLGLGLYWAGAAMARHREIDLTLMSDRGAEILFLGPNAAVDSTLINTGRSNSVDRLVKPFLHVHGVNQLPSLTLTRADSAHAGGLPAVESLFHPRTIFTGPPRPRSAAFDLLGKSSSSSTAWKHLVAGNAAGAWRVLYPADGARSPRAEDDAMVLAATLNGTRVLLLSDLGRTGQRALLARGDSLATDILVASIPPGGDAVSDTLLDASRPALIVILDGEPGSAQHAPPTLRDRLSSRKETILWTHNTGSIKFELRPGSWNALAPDHTEWAHGIPPLR